MVDPTVRAKGTRAVCAFDHAGELVIGFAAMLFLITFVLVWLLPKHAQHAES